MAFTATQVWQLKTTAFDVGGGGFNPGNANFPTDGAATSATGGSPVFSSASYNFVAADVGHWIFIKSGTNWTPGWYQIASVASNNATLTASVSSVVLYSATIGATQYATNTTAGCATVASPTAATWGLDYSQSDSSLFYALDLAIQVSSTTFRSASNPVGKNFVGNVLNVTSGTGFTVQRVEIVSTSTITATCDKTLGTASSTNGAGYLGGSMLSPSLVASLALANNRVWSKAGTYSITSVSTNIAGGCISVTSGAATTPVKWGAWTSRIGDNIGQTVLSASGINTFTLMTNTGQWYLYGITFNGNGLTSSKGCAQSSVDTPRWYNCRWTNFTNGALTCSSLGNWVSCRFDNCSTVTAVTLSASPGMILHGCQFDTNTVSPLTIVSTATHLLLTKCLFYNNTGSGTGAIVTAHVTKLVNCTFYNTGHIAYNSSYANYETIIINCIFVNSGSGTSAVAVNSSGQVCLINNAYYNNSGGNYTTAMLGLFVNQISLTGSPFTNAAGGDFSLNNTVGAGTACRGLGSLSVTSDYADIGALQHQDSTSSSMTSFAYIG